MRAKFFFNTGVALPLFLMSLSSVAELCGAGYISAIRYQDSTSGLTQMRYLMVSLDERSGFYESDFGEEAYDSFNGRDYIRIELGGSFESQSVFSSLTNAFATQIPVRIWSQGDNCNEHITDFNYKICTSEADCSH